MIKQPRTAHAGIRGPDIKAYSRTLRRVNIRHRPVTRFFGLHMVEGTRHFQREHGLTADGVLGPKTFEKLAPHFDGYDKWLIRHTTVKPPPHPRDLVAGACLAMLRHSPFPYHEVRPYPASFDLLYHEGSDCSGTSTLAYKYAHTAQPDAVGDPNGFGFDGYGYTGTLLNHGTRTTTPHHGDLCFYYPAYSHVGVYLGDGRVFSHGGPGQPIVIASSFATQIRSYI